MALKLTKRARTELEAILRSQSGEARLYRRARMVLLVTGGASIATTAETCGTSRARVTDWINRFREHGVAGLVDQARSGRPEVISPLERHQVVAAACRAPRELGHARDTWSHEALQDALIREGLVRSISTSTIGRILAEADLKPHRVKMWCHSRDPAYQEKMRAIVQLYIDPPRGEPVLCVDEKTGMQALSRSRQMKRHATGRPARFEFQYRRNGTRCLFACFNIRTGKVVGRCTRKRKRVDFFAFMDHVSKVYTQRRVHVVLDNLNTHRDTTKGAFLTDWNKRNGNRFVFHYTPTKGSWLNQVELWFGIVTRRILRYGNFKSADELVGAVEAFIDVWNLEEAHPFRWTYDGDPLRA